MLSLTINALNWEKSNEVTHDVEGEETEKKEGRQEVRKEGDSVSLFLFGLLHHPPLVTQVLSCSKQRAAAPS